jgi:uncharacterized protein (TIGR02118 family)
MVKLMFCLVRRPDLDQAAFHRYWREEHAPLVATHAATLHIRRYVQSHTLGGGVNAALAAGRGAPMPYDGVAELWLDSLDDLAAATATPAGAAAGAARWEDERRFIDHARSPIFLVEEHPVI